MDALTNVINEIKSVNCYTTPYLHGFLNPAADYYDKDALALFFENRDLLACIDKPEMFRTKLGNILKRR